MLEMIYQISLLKPYSANISKRFIKSSKMYMTDSGLLCHLLGIHNAEELIQSTRKGNIIESFVYSELLKHIAYSEVRPKIYHYRTTDKKEIDFIIEKGERVFAIEVKDSQTIRKEAFKHIIDFQKKSSKEIIGIVLYAGDRVLSFGDETYARYAMPLGVFF